MVDAARVGGSIPSYKHSLAMIGQYLNQQRARKVTIAEVDTGFIVLFFPGGNYQRQRVLMVQYADLLELNGNFAQAARGRKGGILNGGTDRDKKHPFIPQGYDTAFRALGYKLDHRLAVCVTICEAADRLYVEYWVDKATFVIRENRRQPVSNHQSETYDAAGLEKAIDLYRTGRMHEMQRHQGALRINPHDHLSIFAAALMFEDEGNYRDAEAFLNRIVTNVPDHPEAHYHIARLAYIRGDMRAALRAIHKALRIREDLAALHNLHGRILRQQGKLKEAVAALEYAVSLDADKPIPHYHLAQAYEAQGRKAEAAQELGFISRQQAAPAWEMVQEQMESDGAELPPLQPVSLRDAPFHDSPSAAALLPPLTPADDSPAAMALLPPLPDEDPSEDDLPTLTTDWATALAESQREQPVAAQPPAADQPQFVVVPSPMTGLAAHLAAAQAQTAAETSEPDPQAMHTYAIEPQAADWVASAAVAPAETAPPATLEQRVRVTSQGLSTTGLAAAQPIIVTPPPPVTPQMAAPAFDSALPPGWPFQAQGTGMQSGIEEPQTEVDPLTPRTPFPPVTPHAAAPAEPPEMPLSPHAEIPGTAPDPVELAAEILMTQRAVDAEPNRADLHRKLGFLLARQGRTVEAATEFRKALQCSRTNL